ncbi:hypothetical protein HMPREF9946_04551 [Acetobacteraceae bacterium AT-5844]|nr:hypothetical protein HMPREF9946_04551 [Acetobacteraceae bacterium AT-5844]
MMTAGNWREKEFSLQTTLIFFLRVLGLGFRAHGDARPAKLRI